MCILLVYKCGIICYNIIVNKKQTYWRSVNMAIESIIGFSVLIIAVVGYVLSYYLKDVNWPMLWFRVRGGF